ncbi:MAG: 7 8-dihydro-6-hydroxymethylpterin-pyrophosphokinae hppk [Prosthecobacter sp.]|nr:7 8-dihydro-6-hydroxymethylpterin-pyrophosphokinae hppk [Prosthecobacter sp.]
MIFGIALGSNLGDRAANIQRGIDLLLARVPGIHLAASAPIYETAPVDCAPGTQSFLNTVIEVSADCQPHELHTHLKAIEQTLGRPEQHARNSPRTLDLDLLYADDVISDDPNLILPHPRMHLRRFVLQPLADIHPDLVLPKQHHTVAHLLACLPAEM